MWNLSLTRKDFIDLWLGGSRKLLGLASEQFVGSEPDENLINLQWDLRPSAEYYFPDRVIASDEDLKHIFTAINSSPTAATPVSAYTRILNFKEYKSYFLKTPRAQISQLNITPLELAPFIAMAIAESALLAEDRSSWKQVSLAGCVKTLSFTWGKVVKSGSSISTIEELPNRWFRTYLAVSNITTSESLRRTVTASAGALNTYLKLSQGLQPSGYPEALADALYKRDKKLINIVWIELTKRYGFDISLESLMLATREERASYLQQALKYSLSPEGNESLSALCAFIATQVAPGSLEHLDLLRNSGNPEIVFWYAMYAALLSPDEILGTLGGIGYRLYKLMAASDTHNQQTAADVCYTELKVLERSGIDAFLKKTNSSRELQVELLPYVTAPFEYSSAQQLDLGYQRGRLDYIEFEYHQASRLNHEYKAKVEKAISLLSGIMDDTPGSYNESVTNRRFANRKKPTE
jgi:hypothetical protein